MLGFPIGGSGVSIWASWGPPAFLLRSREPVSPRRPRNEGWVLEFEPMQPRLQSHVLASLQSDCSWHKAITCKNRKFVSELAKLPGK